MKVTERDPATIWTPPEATGSAAGRNRLVGRRILVVGAGTQPSDDADAPLGNGRAISILCAREGAAVACADRDAAAARGTAQRIASEGHRTAVVVADVTDEAACARVVADADAALGGLDGIVVNVGIGYGRGLEGTEANAWDLTFTINLRAHFLIARDDCRAAGKTGDGVGGRVCDGVSARGRVELCDGTAADRGWWIVELEMKESG